MRSPRTLLVMILGLILVGCGASATLTSSTGNEPTTQGAVVFQGNFSAPAQQWPTSRGVITSSSSSDDTYTVQFDSSDRFDAAPTILAVQPQDLINVSVSVSATPISTRPGDRFGVLCRDIQGHSYEFSVGPQASGRLAWSIQLRQPEGVRQIADGTTVTPSAPAYSVRGDCVGGGQDHKPVILALYVGDKLVGQAQDAKLSPPYLGRPGLSVSSASGGTTVGFSSFQVRMASAL